MRPFAAPPGYEHSKRRPSAAHTCLGAQLGAQWRHETGTTLSALAQLLVVSIPLVSAWFSSGRPPTAQHRALLAREDGPAIPEEAWYWWTASVTKAALPPMEARRSIPGLVDTRELGSTRHELHFSIRLIDRDMAAGGLTSPQRAALIKARVSAVGALSRLEEREALEDHPDFEPFALDAISAIERTLEHYGVAPDGARTVFARHLKDAAEKRRKYAEVA